MKTLLLLALLALPSLAPAAADPNLKAFPPAEAGMIRVVINLPPLPDEDGTLRFELIIGKMVKTDAVNHYFFGGTIETETIQGWGFDRYIVRKLGPMAGTLMGVDPSAPQVERFIAIGGEGKLQRYNSRLPLVVYVPAGVEVRYRVWRADPKTTMGAQG